MKSSEQLEEIPIRNMSHSMKMHLQIEPTSRDESGRIILSSLLQMGRGRTHRFFFAIEEEDYHEFMDQRAMPHLISQLMHAMRFGGTLFVDGALSPSHVRHLETFMRRWILWCPDAFRWVEITTNEWKEEAPPTSSRHGAISCFSGGVDSFYSYALLGQDTGIPLRSLVFMHGFDIDLTMSNYYQETANFYQDRLRKKNVRLLKVQTNAKQSARKFQLNWGKVGHGIYLAATLHLLGHDHALACIPSSHSPDSPTTPWGSHPMTDPLLSSSTLPLIHHDYMVPRYEKIAALAQHDDCLEMVRVCWKITENQLNCGYCPKCMPTLLALEVAQPNSWRTAFPHVTTIDSVLHQLSITAINPFQVEQIDIVRNHATRQGRAELAEQLAEIIRQKCPEKASYRMRLRRWFYDRKLRKQIE